MPYRKEYGDGVSLALYYVRNGHLYESVTQFTRVEPDQRLLLSWSTFRDRLYPGQDEEWTLTIRDPKGQPVSGAELLATMYDASLDQFESLYWPFSVRYSRDRNRYSIYSSDRNHASWLSLSFSTPSYERGYRTYDELSEYVHQRWARRRNMVMFGVASNARMQAAPMAMDDAGMMAESIVADEDVLDEVVFGYGVMKKSLTESATVPEASPPVLA